MCKKGISDSKLTVIRTSKKKSGQVYDLERCIFGVNGCFSQSQLRHLYSSPNASFFLLRSNNSSVGFGITLRNKLRNGKYKGRIYSIGVLPACRSKGGGRLLLDAMEKYLIKYNVSSIVLETLKGKGGAELFFTRHGYMESKFLPNYYPYGDAVRMRKA
jgi:ribosomal protein S18 acetylase RimI-like enzyme